VTDFFFGLHTDAVTPLGEEIRLFVERRWDPISHANLALGGSQ
jgi:hypothetical protein